MQKGHLKKEKTKKMKGLRYICSYLSVRIISAVLTITKKIKKKKIVTSPWEYTIYYISYYQNMAVRSAVVIYQTWICTTYTQLVASKLFYTNFEISHVCKFS